MIDIPAETTISRYAIPARNLLLRCEASFPASTPKERSAPGHSRRFDHPPMTSGLPQGRRALAPKPSASQSAKSSEHLRPPNAPTIFDAMPNPKSIML
jgi:hypothetical protein